jgi:hypothetical protein
MAADTVNQLLRGILEECRAGFPNPRLAAIAQMVEDYADNFYLDLDAEPETSDDEPETRARALTEALWTVSEKYHAGAIDFAEFDRQNGALWTAAEDGDLVDLVRARLRDAESGAPRR